MVSRHSLKFCANLSFMFQEHEAVLQRYEAAGIAGFRGVEIDHSIYRDITAVEDIAERLQKYNLEQILINAYAGDPSKGDFGLAGLSGRKSDFLKSIPLTMKYVDILKCKRIHFMTGRNIENPAIQNSPDVCQTLEQNLRLVLPELEQRGAIGLIEPINTTTVPGYLLSDFNAALSIVKSISNSHIKVQVDLFHLQIIQGNWTQWITDNIDNIGHIQISQVPTRNEPHTAGEINFHYLFDLLEKLKYNGWIGLEYRPLNGTQQGLTKFIDAFNIVL